MSNTESDVRSKEDVPSEKVDEIVEEYSIPRSEAERMISHRNY